MRGLLCGTTARTNEEYKKVVKVRMTRLLGVSVLGAFTLILSLLAEFYWKVDIDERMLGVYAGMGSGLIVVGVVLWIKNRIILGDEEKLKESRLSNADERIKEISNKAYMTATAILLIAMYGIALIGGLFYPVMIQILIILVGIFALAYFIAYRVYDKKM
ncbi:hypothetical protein HNQ56_003013 [Anaerotaenia torta]|uniref:hypothetical protein n=1 Tax=Anaerotaenia torta TaxID=433293 RepID=UPI003D20FB50